MNGGHVLALLAISAIGGGAFTGFLREMAMANRTPLEWIYTSLYFVFLLTAVFSLWLASGHLVFARRHNSKFGPGQPFNALGKAQ